MNLKEKLLSLPTSSGCYLMKDIGGNIIYVGKAKNLKRRVNSYFNRKHEDIKTQNLVSNINDFDFIITNTEQDCLILENNLIKKYKPHYNILLKDDKNFPYIKVNIKDDFPYLSITRKLKDDGSKYFGPYFAGVSAYELIEIANSAFNLKTCKQNFDKKFLNRPCLNYSLGLCSAPCVKYISKDDYRKQIDKAIKFFHGDINEVKDILNNKMLACSENENYERAIKLREQLKSLERLKQKYLTQFISVGDFDVINSYFDGINGCFSVLIIRDGKMLGCENFNIISPVESDEIISQFFLQYYSFERIIPQNIYVATDFEQRGTIEKILSEKLNKKVSIIVSKIGDKKKLLNLASSNAKEYLQKSLTVELNKQNRTIKACERLKDILSLKTIPYRMECYDISHISGTNKIASMVVFKNGEPAKSMYRKFNIKTVEGNNDFACLNEALSRRLNELNGDDISFSEKPNLIVIDGGKGQLSATYPLIENKYDIDMISLAEKFEEIFVPKNSNPVVLKKSDVALQLIQRLRDEAHRFAITSHRNKRTKEMVKSELDNIKGLGPNRKKLLLKHFGSIENIKKSTLTELENAKGITKNLALEIYNKFKN